MNIQWSFEILKLVNQVAVAHEESAQDTVARAMLYRFFLEGKSEAGTEELAPVVVKNPAEPGTKRGRPPKAKEGPTPQPIPEFLKASPKYEDIQEAMLKLFDREYGMDAVRDILDSFNVKSVAELKPELYGECLSLLEGALHGKPLA